MAAITHPLLSQHLHPQQEHGVSRLTQASSPPVDWDVMPELDDGISQEAITQQVAPPVAIDVETGHLGSQQDGLPADPNIESNNTFVRVFRRPTAQRT